MNKKTILLETTLHLLINAYYLMGFVMAIIQKQELMVIVCYLLFGIIMIISCISGCRDQLVRYRCQDKPLSEPKDRLMMFFLVLTLWISCMQFVIVLVSDWNATAMIASTAVLYQAVVMQRGYALILNKKDQIYFHHHWISKSDITEVWSDHFNQRIKVILYVGKKRIVEEVNEASFQKLLSLFPYMKEV